MTDKEVDNAITKVPEAVKTLTMARTITCDEFKGALRDVARAVSVVEREICAQICDAAGAFECAKTIRAMK